MRSFLLIAGLIAVIVIVAGGAYVYLELTGRLAQKYEPDALVALLEPDMTVVKPSGAGPFPAIVLLHGCRGLWDGDERRKIMDIYAEIAAAEGVVAIVVDSYRPRGIDDPAAIDAICDGWSFRGGERAGDAAAGLAVARSLSFVDDQRLALAGWSHGGWTAMDLLAMRPERMTPHSLVDWPEAGLSGLVGVYLTYPYCGFPALTRYVGFATALTTWAIHGTDDTTADLADCETAYSRIGADEVVSEVVVGAGHGFDEPANVNFDADQAEIAHDRFRQFLRDVVLPGSM